uniref:hypothetical protein n=1 Tax=Alistipes sp. TaxID=1872444 RepID=UPI0040576AAA
MGFLGSLADAAGEKTGKAIGNAVFGKKAADQVIDVRGSVNNDGGKQQVVVEKKDAVQEAYATQQVEEHRNKLTRKDEIIDLEFSDSDIQQNYRLFFKLIPMVETWYKQQDTDMYELARSKYESGLLMCQMMDPTNPNIALLQGKLNEWDEMIKKGKKAEIKGVIISYIVLALLFGFLALMIFLHNLII